MKIWIDGYEANVAQRLGSSQVAFELLKNLYKIDKKNEYTILLPNPPMSDLPKERDGWNYKIIRPSKFKTWLALPLSLYMAKEKPDVFFSPTHYTPVISPVKRVMMIFDLAYIRFPQYFKSRDLYQMKLWTKMSIKSANQVITISKASKNDIVKYYGYPKDKITVAYPGYNSEIFKPIRDQNKIKKIMSKYLIEGRYVLFTGTIQPRKNLGKLIEAFQKIDDLKLVIVGKTEGEGREGWMFKDILELPKNLGIEDKIIFTGYIPNEDLSILMNGAVNFILPSLWEGFGIPVVDAMACGTPVIVSNVSSLPEVVGKAGLLVNPNSVGEIEQAIRTISSDQKLWKLKSKQGLEQSKNFSWEKMSKIVLKVLTNV